jgi:glycine hydroxymethyltransferase
MSMNFVTDRFDAYLGHFASSVPASGGEAVARLQSLVRDHDEWRSQRCLNLNPAESLLSRSCRNLLASDMATRLTEGLPGDKLYPPRRQNRFIDEIEATIITQARWQFGAKHVEWRPLSTSMANAIAFFATLEPGDVALIQSDRAGGNYSYNAYGPIALTRAKLARLAPLPPYFEIDPIQAVDQIKALRPRIIVLGGSHVLFPYPLRELRTAADAVGAIILYDAAHLGLLVAHGDFQKPLDEGAHLVTISTHKIMGGPVGGMILSNDDGIAAKIRNLTFPAFLQTRDLNKYSALALSLLETFEYGAALARQMTTNARVLAGALDALGFDVLAKERGYTATHQLFLNLGANARQFQDRCQAAGILLADCLLASDGTSGTRSGARIATHEITRLGMGAPEMARIAELIHAAAISPHPERVEDDVAKLLSAHNNVQFSFDKRS